MPLHIVVAAKQVLDPETPLSAFTVDPATKRVVPPPGASPVINGYDEQAVEAALRIREAVGEATITVLSVGAEFAMDTVKRPLAMGADELVLLQDPAFENGPDPTVAVHALAAAIKRLSPVDLVLGGRQASDWDNAQVLLGLAEVLGLPVVTVAQRVEVTGETVRVERVLSDGYEVVEVSLPAVVTISNEVGQARYPTLRGIMTAGRKAPTVWSAAELGLDPGSMTPSLELVELAVPEKQARCEFITGEDEAEAGRKLALRLREAKLV